MIKNLKERMKNKKGFTLVELIVVIVIILVLAAVMVPSLMKYIENANQANCKADAATVLAQIQADYAAKQATTQTGVSSIIEIGGVNILAESTTAVTETTVQVAAKTDAPVAAYGVDTATTEITSFAFNNGDYTATWNNTDGWKVVKSTAKAST